MARSQTTKPNKKKKPTNRVDGMRALDRYTGTASGPRQPGLAPGAGGQPGPVTRGQPPMGGAPGGGLPPQVQHPFLPGQSVHPIVPASLSQSGSAPGTPNLGAMVMRSFQPAVLDHTPLVSSGATGQAQPNPQYNFGGGSQLPPGYQGMQPQQGPQWGPGQQGPTPQRR